MTLHLEMSSDCMAGFALVAGFIMGLLLGLLIRLTSDYSKQGR